MSQKPTLHYFNGKGRAEIVRLTFAAAGVEYADDRFERKQWPELKKTSPTGVAPWLDSERGQMVQGGAIARYYAKKHGLMGQTDWEFYLVERAMSQLDDMYNGVLDAFHTSEDKREEAKRSFFGGKGLSLGKNLETFLKDGGDSGLFVASGLTLADLYCIHVFDLLTVWTPEFAENFPRLKSHTETVTAACPNVAEWLQKRPKSQF